MISYTNQNTICQFSSEADENAEKTDSFLAQLQRRRKTDVRILTIRRQKTETAKRNLMLLNVNHIR